MEVDLLFRLVALALSISALTGLASAQQPDRAAGWRSDLAIVRDEFLPRDLSYTPPEREAALRRLDALDADVPNLTDPQIAAGLAMVAAESANAHTRAYLLRNRGNWRRFPIHIWPFADGWRVIAVRPGFEQLLGVRLTAIGGKPIEAAERAVAPLFAGNAAWAQYMASYSLTSPDALLGVGFVDTDAVQFEGEGAAGRVSATLHAMPFERRTTPEESWWFTSPRHPAAAGWRHVLQDNNALPVFLAAPERNYLVRACAGRTLYVQYFRAQNGEGETVRAFGDRVLALIEQRHAWRVVIDLRFNTGGDLVLALPFFEGLSRTQLAQRDNRIFLISGINTFSAGISPIALMRQEANVTIVGAGPGDELETWSEGGNVPLPYSGITMHYADRAHTYSRVDQHLDPALVWLNYDVDELTPDRPAPWRWTDYTRGRDPSLRAIAHRDMRCGAPIESSGG